MYQNILFYEKEVRLYVWRGFKNMSEEEREMAIEYMEEFLDSVAIGNGDFGIDNNGGIVIED